MSETDQPQDDGIRTEDLGYGDGANAQQGGGLGAALPGVAGGTPPTGTGEQVVSSEVDEAQTKPTTNTSSGSPSVNSPGPNA